jgi:very-short-patch-repair endonuclease
MVGAELERQGVPINAQTKIGRWVIDYSISDTPILIEVDGDYWHSLPGIKERDARKTEALVKLGYTLIRVAEHQVRENLADAVSRILQAYCNFTGKEAIREDGVKFNDLKPAAVAA